MSETPHQCSNCFSNNPNLEYCHKLHRIKKGVVKCRDWHDIAECENCHLTYPATLNRKYCSIWCRQRAAKKRYIPPLRGFASLLGVLLKANLEQQGKSKQEVDQLFKKEGLHW